MIVEKSINPKTFLEIDLTGPDGNVFNLIAIGRKMSGSIGVDEEVFTTEMMSSDYENAINTFEKYFGDYVILYK